VQGETRRGRGGRGGDTRAGRWSGEEEERRRRRRNEVCVFRVELLKEKREEEDEVGISNHKPCHDWLGGRG